MQISNFYILGIIALSISGCATENRPDPAYVSPNLYEEYNCKQISAERTRLGSKLQQAQQTDQSGQVLNTAVTIFAISQGYAFSNGDDARSQELRRIRNHFEVLDQTAIRKKCGI